MSTTPSIRRVGHGASHYVFLHGSPGDSAIWNAVAQLHPPSATCWLLDLPDHGAAPDVGEDQRLLESNVTGSVRALYPRVTLVGHGFGAYLAARVARRLGEQITRLVLISGFAQLPVEQRTRMIARIGSAGDARLGRVLSRLGQLGQPDLAVLPYEQLARVIHGRGDQTVPYGLGSELTSLGKRAALTTLDTDQHMLPMTHAAEIAPLIFSDP